MNPHPGIIIFLAIFVLLTLYNGDKRWTPAAGLICIVVGGLVLIGDIPVWANPIAALVFLVVLACEHLWGRRY